MKTNIFHGGIWILGTAVLVAGIFFVSSLATAPEGASSPVLAQANSTATPTAAATATNTTVPNSASTPAAGRALSGRTVSVSGSGSVQAVPDIAVVSLGVRADAETARNALTQNNTLMQKVITALKTAGIAQTDIQTQALQVQPRYQQPANQPNATPVLVGYTAINTVEVTVRDLTILGTVMDASVTAGSNEIDGIRFDISKPDQLLDQARQAAMQDAQHKASQLATLSNTTLGPVISIDENSQRPVPFSRAAVPQAASSVPVEPGSQTIQVSVSITWELIAP